MEEVIMYKIIKRIILFSIKNRLSDSRFTLKERSYKGDSIYIEIHQCIWDEKLLKCIEDDELNNKKTTSYKIDR